MNDAQSVSFTLSDEQAGFLGWFEFRVRSPEPMLPCDDPDNWPTIYRRLSGCGASLWRQCPHRPAE